MAVKVKFPDGSEATIHDFVWSYPASPIFEEYLNQIKSDEVSQGSNADPDFLHAQMVAARMGGEIVHHDRRMKECEPDRIY